MGYLLLPQKLISFSPEGFATGLHAFLPEVTTFPSKPAIARKVLVYLLLFPHVSHDQETEVLGEEPAHV